MIKEIQRFCISLIDFQVFTFNNNSFWTQISNWIFVLWKEFNFDSNNKILESLFNSIAFRRILSSAPKQLKRQKELRKHRVFPLILSSLPKVRSKSLLGFGSDRWANKSRSAGCQLAKRPNLVSSHACSWIHSRRTERNQSFYSCKIITMIRENSLRKLEIYKTVQSFTQSTMQAHTLTL